jgi:DNA polymerase V
MTERWKTKKAETFQIPFYASLLHAGFPSPADDYKENILDLNELVIQNPGATFYVRVKGDSMKGAGIEAGDVIVVDRAITARHNAVIVALINGEFTLKRLYNRNNTLYLVPENPSYETIKIVEGMEFQVWGVVTYCIHKVR